MISFIRLSAPAQNAFIETTAFALASFRWEMASWLFATPFDTKYTSKWLGGSGQVMRIDLSRVALRTTSFTSPSQLRRRFGLAHTANSTPTGTSTVLLALA